jgi:hypothetical protein
MIDYEQLQKDVQGLEKQAEAAKKADPAAMKAFAIGLRDILTRFLKDRREPIRPGQIFKDAAAKNIVPGDIAPRGDALLIRWTGQVTPVDPQAIKDDAAKLASVAEKTLPVLKAYRKKE